MALSANEKEIIRLLNGILKNELTAINQYFLHAKILEHQGFAALAKLEYEESIDEMKHADMVAQRILFLNGLPNFQELGKLHVGETMQEMLSADFDMEAKAIKDLKEAIAVTEAQNDFATADILHGILASEEKHYLWLQQQLTLIEKMGVENYAQLQV